MPKPTARANSRYSRDALVLLGQMIKLARIDKKLTGQELADRAGISRGLLQRIEKGDSGCAVGAVFEVAAIVGVPLFDPMQSVLAASISANKVTLKLLPKSVRPTRKQVKDDF